MVTCQPLSRRCFVVIFLASFGTQCFIGYVLFQHITTRICTLPLAFALSFAILAVISAVRGEEQRYLDHTWHVFVSLVFEAIGFVTLVVIVSVLGDRMT